MSVTLEILSSNATLTSLEATIKRAESRGYRLISITTGFESGSRANLLTLLQGSGGPPSAPLSLEIVNGGSNKDQQEAKLNSSGKQVVCYGSLYVEGQPQNVAAYR